MGLDWNPIGRPRPGFEAELEHLLSTYWELQAEGDKARLDRAGLRIVEITVPVHTDLGAPRVGDDPAADRWVVEQVRKTDPAASAAQILEQHAGYYVLDLLPPNPGFPVYTSWGYPGVDRYTFRGKFLDDLGPILGDDLVTAGYGVMTARELEAHGNKLLRKATEWAVRIDRTGLLFRRDAPDDFDGEEGGCHITASAAQWCLYWARRGHGMEPYF
jgi:hypothetical protein